MTTSLHSPAPWIALLPLGLYLLGLSWAHLRRRPLAVSGVFDVAMLATGVSGLAVVGPLALLVPVTGGSPWSWPVLAFLFVLCVAICVLVSRPRMVVYNITVEQFRPLVAEVVAALDPKARWAGESAALPDRGFQLHIEGNGALRTVSIVNVGERSSAEGWGEFTRRLRRAVRGLRVRRSPWGSLFAAVGGGLVALAVWLALGGPVWHWAAAAPASPSTVAHFDLSGRPSLMSRGSSTRSRTAHGDHPMPTHALATLILSLAVATLLSTAAHADQGSPLNGTVKKIDGTEVDLSKYKGKVVLIVNVASRCGYTGQYAGLQKLHDAYKDKGLVVLGFPANEFGAQEPGTDAEIATFCSSKYGVTFDMFSKIVVKGPGIAPLYKTLTESADPKGDVGWNFEKFLIGRDGRIVGRYKSGVSPDDAKLKAAIEAELGKAG